MEDLGATETVRVLKILAVPQGIGDAVSVLSEDGLRSAVVDELVEVPTGALERAVVADDGATT